MAYGDKEKEIDGNGNGDTGNGGNGDKEKKIGGNGNGDNGNGDTEFDPTIASFTASPHSGTIPLTVTFTNQSHIGDGELDRYEWYLGDGSIIETDEANPHLTYTYTDAGYLGYVIVVLKAVMIPDTNTAVSDQTIITHTRFVDPLAPDPGETNGDTLPPAGDDFGSHGLPYPLPSELIDTEGETTFYPDKDGHTHSYQIDANGNGWALYHQHKDGTEHRHEILGFFVSPGWFPFHIHNLTHQP